MPVKGGAGFVVATVLGIAAGFARFNFAAFLFHDFFVVTWENG